MIGDIDFLVKEKDYIKTVNLLLNLGYKSNFKPYFEINDQKHYPRLYNEDVAADLEVHRIPVDKEFGRKFDSNTIFTSYVKINKKLNCYIPSDLNNLILSFIHNQLINKGYKLRQFTLRDSYDFYLLSKKLKLDEVINAVEEKVKIQTYYNCTSLLLNPSVKYDEIKNKKSKKFLNQYYWFLNHPRIHWLYIKTLNFFYFAFIKLPRLFLSKSMLNSLINRFTDKNWWKIHLINGLKKNFK
jgi:hypothetical protein